MYVMTCTRRGVSYALSMTSIFQKDHGEEHWTAVKNIIRAVAWKSLKKDIIAISSTKAECIFVLEIAQVAYLMKKFIEELGEVQSIKNPVKVYCDNSNTVLLVNECITQSGSRHMLHRHHYIREVVSLQNVEVIKVHIDEHIADHLTNALPCDKHEFHVSGMGLCFVGLESSWFYLCIWDSGNDAI
ncbi:hypothetical protein Tco_0552016 [Tanacetum coccineum]